MPPLNVPDFMPSKFSQHLLHQAVACNTEGTLEDAGATEKAMIKFITRC